MAQEQRLLCCRRGSWTGRVLLWRCRLLPLLFLSLVYDWTAGERFGTSYSSYITVLGVVQAAEQHAGATLQLEEEEKEESIDDDDNEEELTFHLIGVSGTLQEGFPLRPRMDYTVTTKRGDRTIRAVFVGRALVRGYKAYLDVKKPNTASTSTKRQGAGKDQNDDDDDDHNCREYVAPPDPPVIPNAVVLATGCYHHTNAYHLYFVPTRQLLHILAGEPRYLSIAPDSGLIDLIFTKTSNINNTKTTQSNLNSPTSSSSTAAKDDFLTDDAVVQLARREIQKHGKTDFSVVAIPLVTGVYWDAESFVESPIIATLADGTTVTSFAESLNAWASSVLKNPAGNVSLSSIHDDSLGTTGNETTSATRTAAWNPAVVLDAVRYAEQEQADPEMSSMLSPYTITCEKKVRMGTGPHQHRINYPFSFLQVQEYNAAAKG